mmetsp:Transcript_144735/g.360836  ORF Transcript_144735/g.360836 Transcript_144735/m.360836 type:complete len:254 (+) Transcript_144735:73-834(+)|eukprot:CAMPEP_0115179490 /NCGR_PEP_ID=MMETSP0270-20121206/6437_1 /TAXON_ID=71861 /ORGANISM="Scrippsiella trochoidea, Strain CCMP3099" /LENGTH=253 /DNA_ID=CAMNT_0002592473 /DNA_START=54 /DNA_END=815 /DNA_ORIENTATION=+
MDPFTVSATAITVALAAGVSKTNRDNWVKDRSLPQALKEEHGDVSLPVVAVHVRRVDMVPDFQGEPLRICIKYGVKGAALGCDTASFIPEVQARPRISRLVSRQPELYSGMQIDSTCLFLLSQDIQPIIRVLVRKAGLRRNTIAEARISLMQLSERGLAELPLVGPSGHQIGKVAIACKALEVLPCDLTKSLAVARATSQKGAYLFSGVSPIVEGALADETSGSDDGTPPASLTTPLAGKPVLHSAINLQSCL